MVIQSLSTRLINPKKKCKCEQAFYCFLGFYVCGRPFCVINLNLKGGKFNSDAIKLEINASHGEAKAPNEFHI